MDPATHNQRSDEPDHRGSIRPITPHRPRHPSHPQHDHDEEHDPLEIMLGNDPEADHWNTLGRPHAPTRIKAPHRRGRWIRILKSDGFHVVFALLGLMLSLGFLALALTLASATFTLPTLVLSVVCVVWAALRWRLWLASAPYFYRLMSSLGEDAENLLETTIGSWIKATARRFGPRNPPRHRGRKDSPNIQP